MSGGLCLPAGLACSAPTTASHKYDANYCEEDNVAHAHTLSGSLLRPSREYSRQAVQEQRNPFEGLGNVRPCIATATLKSELKRTSPDSAEWMGVGKRRRTYAAGTDDVYIQAVYVQADYGKPSENSTFVVPNSSI